MNNKSRSKEDEVIVKKSVKFINCSKVLLIDKFANNTLYEPDRLPFTVFMAGSPGAGKTEFSRELIRILEYKAIRIDADDIRKIFEDYNGLNAHLFQKATSIGIDIIYNYCLLNKFNVVLDGTFAHKRVVENIQKSLTKNRGVTIDFIYQEPDIAWNFTQKREVTEHRRITKETFIRTFLLSKENANMVKLKFGDKIKLNLFIKNINNDQIKTTYLDIENIDPYLNKIYTYNELNYIIS